MNNSLLLLEGQWIDSVKKGYQMRIDKPTEHTQKLHVHIVKDKHINRAELHDWTKCDKGF